MEGQYSFDAVLLGDLNMPIRAISVQRAENCSIARPVDKFVHVLYRVRVPYHHCVHFRQSTLKWRVPSFFGIIEISDVHSVWACSITSMVINLSISHFPGSLALGKAQYRAKSFDRSTDCSILIWGCTALIDPCWPFHIFSNRVSIYKNLWR